MTLNNFEVNVYAVVVKKAGVLLLDGVKCESVHEGPASLLGFDGWLPEVWMVTLDAGGFAPKLEENEGAWGLFKLRINPVDIDANASLFFLNGSPAGESRVHVEYMGEPETRALKKIKKYAQLAGSNRVNKGFIERLFSDAVAPFHNNKRLFLVHDVGQANWNSLVVKVSESVMLPILFFDYGVPTGFNFNTRPAHLIRPDSGSNPDAIVVLSHWDMDHWAGAAFGQPSYGRSGIRINWCQTAIARKWLVPGKTVGARGQQLTPSAWLLAIALYKNGSLFVWPARLLRVKNQLGDWLVKCRPQQALPKRDDNNNNNGLTIYVSCQSDQDVFVLSPGDAQYSSILSPNPHKKIRIKHLVATHHGGVLAPNTVLPTAVSSQSKVVFSHGNRYPVPIRTSKQIYANQGWLNQLETFVLSGSVGFPGYIELDC